jgi:hypothetical protein
LRREDAEGISDNLHGGAKCRGGDVPCAVLIEENEVGEEGDGEENHAQEADGERRCIAELRGQPSICWRCHAA